MPEPIVQPSLLEPTPPPASGPVECLGLTFPNDDARRAYFTEQLRAKLQDPAFRQIEGFPIGSDEDILALSDPPYYTACPNPFIEDFIKHYGRLYDASTDIYHCEPFATDVSEGKGDLLYSAHSYHTKVPPKAIAKYILHYTKPGDIVFDPFAGSGMTGLAAILCGNREAVDPHKELDGVEWGVRIPLLIDLSPAASLISRIYIAPPNAEIFEKVAGNILAKVVEQVAEEWQLNGNPVSYFIKAEAFICPICQSEIVTDHVVQMTDSIGSANAFHCPACNGLVSKAPTQNSGASRLERHLLIDFDKYLNKSVPLRREKTISALLDNGKHKIFSKLSNEQQQAIDALVPNINSYIPIQPLIAGDRFLIKDCCASYGISHIHHFYTPRQLRYISELWNLAISYPVHDIRLALMFFIQSYGLGATRLNRFIPPKSDKELPGSQVNRYFSGTLYIPSLLAEVSPKYLFEKKIDRLHNAFSIINNITDKHGLVSTQSATSLDNLLSNSIDYIFVDPPFGQNLQYSELNQIWESWLRIATNRNSEAVVDITRKRNVFVYGDLMCAAFAQMFKVLKPRRWITLEFHNSFNSVWNAIQEALFAAGFIVSDVRVLDKQQGTYKQSRQGLVKQDLVVSAYKPDLDLEIRFRLEAGTEMGVWDFVRNHLRQLPIFTSKDNKVEIIAERQNYLLFDRMVAFHIQRGVNVPMSAAEFYQGLEQRFPERDSMHFLPEQAAEYDKKRMTVSEVLQLSLIITDESSAIQWIKQQLMKKPQTLQELHPQFMRELGGWEKHEMPLELLDLLEQNFLRYDGKGDVPSQIHSYLSTNYKELRNLPKDDAELRAKAKDRWYLPDPNKATDLEKLREKALLREFEEYRTTKQKRLKVFRLEAVRAGFKKAWQDRDYATIIAIAEKIPENVLQEDAKLLMWYDQALTRTEQ